MENIKTLLENNKYVNVESNTFDYVYDQDLERRIKEAIDKPRAIGRILAEKLNAPQNLRLYIKLAYQYKPQTLFECVALTNEAQTLGIINTSKAQYFYGIVRSKKNDA